MNTFSLKELRDCLIDKNAFIAHCAGYAKGVGNNQTDRYSIFERIHHAIFDDIEISCSTIVPGDNFQGNNYTGTLGIILFPKAPNSITFASCSDSGTSIDIGNPTRRKYKNIKSDISLENIQKCILDRNKTDYNEFCILAYHVVGVFIGTPIQASIKEGIITYSESEVYYRFPYFPYYVLQSGILYNAQFDDKSKAFLKGEQRSIADIYPVSLLKEMAEISLLP